MHGSIGKQVTFRESSWVKLKEEAVCSFGSFCPATKDVDDSFLNPSAGYCVKPFAVCKFLQKEGGWAFWINHRPGLSVGQTLKARFPEDLNMLSAELC